MSHFICVLKMVNLNNENFSKIRQQDSSGPYESNNL